MTAKAEALQALSHARALLDNPGALTPGLQLVQLRSFLDYAAEQVEGIEELKRKRSAETKPRKKKGAAEPGAA